MFNDKIVIVIGVFCGIGCLIVFDLVNSGVNVVVNYFGNEVKVNEVVDEIKLMGRKVIVVKVDVLNFEDV